MRRVIRFTRLSSVLLTLLISGFAYGQYIGVPGPGPVAPAPDFPESSPLSEEQPKPPPHIHPYDLWQATHLTVRGTDDRIYDNLLTSVGWTGWAAVPGNMLTPSGPAATVFNGELWYVVRGADDRIYRNLLPAVAASDWTGWVEVLLGGGFTPSEPGAAATASTLYLVVRGEDNGIYLNQATLP